MPVGLGQGSKASSSHLYFETLSLFQVWFCFCSEKEIEVSESLLKIHIRLERNCMV